MNAVNATLNVNKHPFNLRKIERFKMKTILSSKILKRKYLNQLDSLKNHELFSSILNK